MPRSRAAVIGGLVLMAMVACADGGDSVGPSGEPWGAAAEVWFDAHLASAERGGALAASPFYAEQVEIDARTVVYAQRPFVGWDDAYAHHWRHAFVAGQESWRDESVFLDTGGSVNVGTYADPMPLTGLLVSSAVVINLEIDREGFRRQIPTLSTTDLAGIGYGDEITRGADAVARAWTETWTSGTPDDFDAFYTPSATVGDTARRLFLIGPNDLVTRRDIESLHWSLDETALGYPAVYAYSTGTGRLEGVLLVAVGAPAEAEAGAALGDADEGVTACPGRQAIWLELSADGRVTGERRFWSVDDARRCGDASSLPDGWWTVTPLPMSAVAPHENLARVTSRLEVGGRTVEIRNGTPTLQLLVGWAVARFDQAGMALPRFESVTFTRHADYCEEVEGRAIPVFQDGRAASWELVLCFDETSACADPSCDQFTRLAKRTTLHELAHVWIADNVSESQRTRFLDQRELETWGDNNWPWEQRGVEWAADTIAWGLLDGPFSPSQLGSPSEPELTEGFRLLTGLQPLQSRR